MEIRPLVNRIRPDSSHFPAQDEKQLKINAVKPEGESKPMQVSVDKITIQTRSDNALVVAMAFEITDDKSRLALADFLHTIKALMVEVKADREDERLKAKTTLDAIVAGRNRHLLPLQQAEKIIKQKQIADEDEQNRKRKEAQDELDRLEQIEAEALADEQALIAAELEDVGDVEQAKAVLEAPIEPPAPYVIPDTKPTFTGQHTTVYWKCRLINFAETPIGLHQFDQVAANKWVAGIKSDLTKVHLDTAREVRNLEIIKQIAELPNGTVLTKEIIGVDTIPGVEIYIEKSRAAGWR